MSGPSTLSAIGSVHRAISLDGVAGGGVTRGETSFAHLLQEARATPILTENHVEPLTMHSNGAISLRDVPARNTDDMRESAKQLVASALLMPVLEQMDASPLRPVRGPFAQTTVEKRFGPMLHQHMADRMMQSDGRSFGLVDAIVNRMERGRVEVTG